MPDNFPFLGGSPASFAELYPQVRSLKLKITARPITFGDPETWDFSEETISSNLLCPNPSCSGGGFNISWLVARHVHDLKVHDEGSQPCKGQERGKGGSRSCYYRFKYSIDVEYADKKDAPSPNETV